MMMTMKQKMACRRARGVGLLLLGTLGCMPVGKADVFGPRARVETIEVDGRLRRYRLYVPPSLGDKPAPLLLAFHGGGGEARGFERHVRFNELADRDGFIVVYPNAYKRHWNDGRGAKTQLSYKRNINDVRFVERLIEEVNKEHALDRRRIFATGISNGGIFSHYLAGQASQKIAAIAPVVGGMGEPYAKEFKPTSAVSVLVIQGSEDPLVPINGGAIAGNPDSGSIIPTGEATELWVNANRCKLRPIQGELADLDSSDGCRSRSTSWLGCDGGTEVKLVTVEGGGHTWPGGEQYLPRKYIGQACRDYDGSEFIWEFFKSHPKAE